MKALTTEQFNALPEERRKYWKQSSVYFGEAFIRKEYTPIQINLEDAERVLEELRGTKVGYEQLYINGHNDALTTALNNLKQLTNGH